MKFKTPTTLFVCALFLLTLSTGAQALSASNAGFTGLWEYPTADMPGDGQGWVSLNSYEPYRSYSVNLGLFPWLEWNMRLTRFATGPILSEGYGRYKDKAMDFKLLLIKQKGFFPAVAIGALDTTGTEIRKAYFGVGTWHFGYDGAFAVSLGYANKAYNGIFGGVSWQAADWLEFKAEYSPLDYTKDYAAESGQSMYIHPNPAKSKFNYGIVLKSPWGFSGSVSYQRGEQLSFGISYQYDMKKPFLGFLGDILNKDKRKNKNNKNLPDTESNEWSETDIEKLAQSLQSKLGEKGLRNIVILASDRKEMHIAFENIGYASQSEAMARVVLIASQMVPWDTEKFSCAAMVRGRAVSRVDITKEQAALIRLGKINRHDFSKNFVSWTDGGKYGTNDEWNMMAGPGKTLKKGTYEIRIALAYEPRIDRTLYKDYMHRWDIDYIGRVRSSDGWEAYLKIRQPISNTVDIWWEPEMTDQTKIWQGVLSYVHRFNERLWAVGEAGWLDINYFGANVWGRWYLKNSPLWLGGRMSVTKERDFASFSGLPDYKRGYMWGHAFYSPGFGTNDWTLSWWGQAGYHGKMYDVDVIGSYGKFVNGDKGYRIDASRNWGATTVGFYWTNTDIKTSGKGYTDVGMNLRIPLSAWFKGHESSTVWTQEFTLLSVFTLDGGKIPGAWMPPEILIGELVPQRLENNLTEIFASYGEKMRGEEQKKSPVSYGLWEYFTGNWREIVEKQ